MVKVLVIGGGFSGCTISFLLKKKGYDITIVEKDGVLGGGCRTYFYKGHPYTFGPRHLNVDKNLDDAWKFLNENIDLRMLSHHAYTLPADEDRFFTYPPAVDEIDDMKDSELIKKEIEGLDDNSTASNFEEYWEKTIGRTLYSKFIKEYSKKMWDIEDNKEIELDNIPVHKRGLRPKGTEYFDGKQYCAYPKNIDGYNGYFDRCVEGCNVLFNTEIEEYDIGSKKVKICGEWKRYDIIVSTVSLDELFNYCYGELKYRGRDFIKLLLPVPRVFPDPYVFLYYAGDEPYTRVVEYKLLTGYESDHTLLGIEFPSYSNKMYPYSLKTEIEKAEKYKKLLPEDVYSIGRMGEYKYRCMAEIVDSALKLAENI